MSSPPRSSQVQTATAASSAASRWTIDPAHSSVVFEVRHLGISFVSGRFHGFAGTVAVDEADPRTARVEATIDAATIDTGVPQRDDHLRSPDFFDVASHPTIRFVGKRVEALQGDEATLVGDLTIRGITREVPLRVERTGEVVDPQGQRRVGARAEGTVRLQDFGLTWNQPLGNGTLALGDKVRLVLAVEGVREGS